MHDAPAKRFASSGARGALQPRPKHLSFRVIVKEWWLEILACVLIIAVIAAVVVTIRLQQDRPLYHWPYDLSINSIISIYSVVVKAAILLIVSEGLSQLKWVWYTCARPLKDLEDFDKASRGEIWGSLLLIWRLRLKSLASSIAALITLAVLLVDPFAQQIVRYYSCSILDDGAIAFLPRTNRYDYLGFADTASFDTVDNGMQAAMNAALQVSSHSSRVVPTCTSGNCTFAEPLQTLGYCSSCIDITDRVQAVNMTVKDPFGRGDILKSNISLPSGLQLVESADLGGIQAFMKSGFDFPDEFVVLAGFLDPARQKECEDPDNKSWGCQGAGAASCKIGPCVKTFDVKLENGQLQETLKDTYVPPELDGQSPTETSVDLSCLSKLTQANGPHNASRSTAGARWMTFNPATQGEDPSSYLAPNMTIPQECVYSMMLRSALSLVPSFQAVFNGSLVPNDQAQNPAEARGKATLLGMYQQGNVSFETVNSALQSLTEAMTNYIREHGAPGWSEPLKGQTWRTDTCVRVEWGWLALPAALTAFTLVFFVVMILQTRRGEVGHNHNWKSSTLPLLFHGLDERTRWRQGELARLDAMEKSAKSLHVKLDLTDEGWRLAPVE
ncbi:MAG: hypothetical protein M1828_003466 [Chrysothrix sp. TS-e1954]|nr:MAG: hypothetical protein M1828_003466 [Chrysothrix sp. TS-e1954]